MRVTFCTTDGWNAINGINAWLVEFLPAFRARGHDARVLLFPWSEPGSCATLPALRAASVPVEIVAPGSYTESAVRACLRHTRRFDPDVFVANMVTPALHASGWLRAAGIPTVGVIHNDDDEYRAKIAQFGGANAFFRLSTWVAISSGLLRLTAAAATDFPVRCIPYGLTPPRRKAQWSGTPPLRLIYHGRIVQEQKRILDTITACVRLSRQYPAIAADFYGSGPDEAAAAALLAKDSAEGRVRLLGRVEPGRIPEILAGYQVAVLLSEYEGLGLSILEAMAAGLVPVCHRTASGLPDLIESGRNGIFVDDRGPDFDTAILSLLQDPVKWTELAQAARATVTARFSLDASLAAWESLGADLARDRPPHLRIAHPCRIALQPVDRALAGEDHRYPGLARAVWRRVRFPQQT